MGPRNENATAESYCKTLKYDEVHLQQYRTFAAAEADLGRVIDEVYNAKRPHSGPRYRPPVEFEAADGAARTT